MLTKKDKRAIMRLVSHRNEHLKGSRFWDVLEYCITLLMMIVLAFSIRCRETIWRWKNCRIS